MTLLAPGHHLYPGDDGEWRFSAPHDRFVRVTGDPSTLAAFQRVVHGAAPSAEARTDADPEAFAQLSELFAARDLLDPDSPAATTTTLIAIEGEAPLCRAVARLLEGTAQVVQCPLDEDAVRAADVAISCAGWLPDAHWRQLDTWCAAHGTAWHRLHVEDVRFFLGPLTVPGRTACYEDLRGRRLAACGMADELLQHWAYLDDPVQPAPPVPWPGAAGQAVLAGLLAHDVLSYLRTGTPAIANAELEVDLAPVRVVPHQVLPLPMTARP